MLVLYIYLFSLPVLCSDSSCNMTDKNPYHGYVSFDNFGSTSLNIFQVRSCLGW